VAAGPALRQARPVRGDGRDLPGPRHGPLEHDDHRGRRRRDRDRPAPGDTAAREALADIYQRLGYGAENATWRSFYLTGALELREGVKPPAVGDLSAGMAGALTIEQPFDAVAIRVDGPRAATEQLIIDWHFTGTGTDVRLTLSNGALIQTTNPKTPAAADLTLTKPQLLGLLAGHGIEGIHQKGDPAPLSRLLALLDTPDPAFPIVTP
jgi:alkyl sulfatase BDS1-like metallo-beta-lactamase superfamily hydrolase